MLNNIEYGDRERVIKGLISLKHNTYESEIPRQNSLEQSIYALKSEEQEHKTGSVQG
jgi:hypothetical protein